jgi:hypothetical protein
MQDRCTVCADCVIGLLIVLGTPVKLVGDVGQVEARFALFGHSVNLSVR